jgi:hypothetical protein
MMNIDNPALGMSIRQNEGDKNIAGDGGIHAQCGSVGGFIKTSGPFGYGHQLGETGTTRASVKRNFLSTFIPTTFCGTSKENCRRLLSALALVSWSQVASAQTLPTDIPQTCGADLEIATWFTTGTVAANGGVDPADGLQFKGGVNCNFFKWAWQMFLWLNSSPPANYGGGTHVFNSPVFYAVSALAADGTRTLMRNAPDAGGCLTCVAARSAQVGPRGTPVTVDKAGKIISIVRPRVGPNGKTIIRNRSGRMIEVERIQVGRNRKPVFLDKAGRAIDFQAGRSGNPILIDQSGRTIEIRRVTIGPDGQAIFLDALGRLVDVGQAMGSEVLMAQNRSLVYYATYVNDVYAYLMTGTKTVPGITPTPTQFPTTKMELDSIIAFANAKGQAFPDTRPLAIEVKTAWVETSGFTDLELSKYVTMTTRIPSYQQVSPQLWVRSGSRPAQLALVGMHVVGSTAGGPFGHPEMLWATFEHIGNTPNEAYTYSDINNQPKMKPRETALPPGQGIGGKWLFSANNSIGPFNVARMSAAIPTEIRAPSLTIDPSDTLRANPWGSPNDGFHGDINTEVISINATVLAALENDDVRKNYLLHGTTWTQKGNPPPALTAGTSAMTNTSLWKG